LARSVEIWPTRMRPSSVQGANRLGQGSLSEASSHEATEQLADLGVASAILHAVMSTLRWEMVER
jgi:hypothetical protein